MCTHERSGTLLLRMVIFLITALRAPANGSSMPARSVDAAAPAMVPATAAATEVTGRRGELTTLQPLQPELIVSIGRFRWSWPKDAWELSSRLRGLTGALCLAASVLRLVDSRVCRHDLTVELRDTIHYLTTHLAAESRP